MAIRTAIFPVAGMGTRFLPATKAVPRELLPVLGTSLIKFATDKVRAAGVKRVVFVRHPERAAIERHVVDDRQLAVDRKDQLFESLIRVTCSFLRSAPRTAKSSIQSNWKASHAE